MPKKTDRRVQRTRQTLHKALTDLILEKRYDKITVQDIIDRANVGRSTFYAHFLDKEDLLLQGLQIFGEQFRAHAAEHEHDHDHVLHSLVFFQHAYENQDLYRAMLDGGGADFFLETGRKHITADVQQHLNEILVDGAAPVPLEVITHFLAGAMMSLLTWWLDSKMPYAPTEINAMFQRLAMPSIQQFLDRN